jgi:hypothetical protein
MVPRQVGVMFSPQPGTVDAACAGLGSPYAGTGTIAGVRFHAIASGAPGIAIASVIGRGTHNEPLAVDISNDILGVPSLPAATELHAARPNPSRDRTAIEYALAERGDVDLAVYSVDGRRVATLAHGTLEPGRYTAAWNGTTDGGTRAAAGVYWARLHAAGHTYARALVRIE